MYDPLKPNYSFSEPLTGTWATEPTTTTTPGEQRARMLRRSRAHKHHQLFLIPSPSPLTSISDLVLSWSRGEWLIIEGHSYHPDFYINWRLRKLVGAVLEGKVYRAVGADGEVYRVDGWEIETGTETESKERDA